LELVQFITSVLQGLTSWLPRILLVNVTERAVKFVRGKEPIFLEPGLHWWLPLTTTCEKFSILRDATEFEPVVVPDRDGKPIAIGFAVIWHIAPEDTVKAATTTDDHMAMVGEVGESLLPPLVLQYSFSELMDRIRGGRNMKTINDMLTEEAKGLLSEYGITVDRCRINFTAPARVFKVIGNPVVG
jgi:regulator of protease activity HflC (stomatin/prohibitin superfamily)